MEIYLVYEDICQERKSYAFISKEKAVKKHDEIISQYPEHMRTAQALYEDNIYIGIERCKLEE